MIDREKNRKSIKFILQRSKQIKLKWLKKKIMKKTKTDFKMMMLLPILFYEQILNDTFHVIPYDTSSFIHSSNRQTQNYSIHEKNLNICNYVNRINWFDARNRNTHKKKLLNKYISNENRKLKHISLRIIFGSVLFSA